MLIEARRRHKVTTAQLADAANQIQSLISINTDLNKQIANLEFTARQAVTNMKIVTDNTTERIRAETEKGIADWVKTNEKKIRADAIKRSKHTNRGFSTEHQAPFMIPRWDHKDFRFLGGTVDYVVFNNLNEDELDVDVVLLDIKTGNADLNKRQRRIRNAVIQNKVSFCTYNPDKAELRTWDSQKNGVKETMSFIFGNDEE